MTLSERPPLRQLGPCIVSGVNNQKLRARRSHLHQLEYNPPLHRPYVTSLRSLDYNSSRGPCVEFWKRLTEGRLANLWSFFRCHYCTTAAQYSRCLARPRTARILTTYHMLKASLHCHPLKLGRHEVQSFRSCATWIAPPPPERVQSTYMVQSMASVIGTSLIAWVSTPYEGIPDPLGSSPTTSEKRNPRIIVGASMGGLGFSV